MCKFTLMVAITSLVTITALGYPHHEENAHVLHPEDQAAVAATKDEQPAEPQDDSDLYMQPLESQVTSSEEPMEGGQTFYPSFSPFNHPPLGHSRPFVYQQEGAYSHRAAPYQQQVDYDSVSRFSGYKGDSYARGSETVGLLGSGNFGVIRGGTFYHENEDSSNYDYDPFFRHNGHGRPGFGYGANPKPRQHQQFENFRDFADINVPTNPAYSQYVIVYANKNITSDPLPNNKPKNIIEHLQMLDLETTTTAEVAPPKKLSKYKQKLALAKQSEKKALRYKKKGQRTTTESATLDQYEPLLALS